MFTDIIWRFLILETFVMGALCYVCFKEHPQKQFCTSEFVLKVKFHEEINLPVEPMSRMEIRKVFKGYVHELNRMDNIYVNVEMSTNVKFTDGYLYFIFGRNKNGNIYSDMCRRSNSWVIPTTFFKRGLAKYYKTGCDCIDEIPRYTGAKYCHWNYSFLRRRGRNCYWVNTRYFRHCKMGFAISGSSK